MTSAITIGVPASPRSRSAAAWSMPLAGMPRTRSRADAKCSCTCTSGARLTPRLPRRPWADSSARASVVRHRHLEADDDSAECEVQGNRLRRAEGSELLNARIPDALRSERRESDAECEPDVRRLLDEPDGSQYEDCRRCCRCCKDRHLADGNARKLIPSEPLTTLDALAETV